MLTNFCTDNYLLLRLLIRKFEKSIKASLASHVFIAKSCQNANHHPLLFGAFGV